MCFEWDKRYFRELEEKKAREKLDQMLKQAEEAARQGASSEAKAESDSPNTLKRDTVI